MWNVVTDPKTVSSQNEIRRSERKNEGFQGEDVFFQGCWAGRRINCWRVRPISDEKEWYGNVWDVKGLAKRCLREAGNFWLGMKMVLIQGKPVFQVWFGGPVWLLQFLMMIMMADPFAIGCGVVWEGKGMDRTHRWGKIIFAFLRMDHHMLIFIMVTVVSASLSSCLSYSLPPLWCSSQYKPRPGQVQLFLVLWRRGVPSEGSEAPTGEWWRWL